MVPPRGHGRSDGGSRLHWRFYHVKHRHDGKPVPTVVFDPERLNEEQVPAGSLLLVDASPTGEPVLAFRPSLLHRVAVIKEPSGVASFAVMQR